MKILYDEAGRILGTPTDDYSGLHAFVQVDDEFFFDVERAVDFKVAHGVLMCVNASRLTRLAFRNRFTRSEKIGLELASQHNAVASLPAQQQAATLRAYLADLAAAEYIDLSRTETRLGVQYLEEVVLLAPGRALEILDAPVVPEERHL